MADGIWLWIRLVNRSPLLAMTWRAAQEAIRSAPPQPVCAQAGASRWYDLVAAKPKIRAIGMRRAIGQRQHQSVEVAGGRPLAMAGNVGNECTLLAQANSVH